MRVDIGIGLYRIMARLSAERHLRHHYGKSQNHNKEKIGY